ncbi:MAG: septum formation initiator family protein [Candidatus Omnitrophota bacterium]
MVHVLRRGFWLFGSAVLLLIIFLPGYTKLQELRDKNKGLEAQIRQLNIDNSLLVQELKRVQTDALYQEKIAREKMGVVRKGEIPVKIIPEKKKR